MHDAYAVQGLIERLLRMEPASLAEVRVRAGGLRSAESLELAYRILSQDTPLEGSRLVVEPPSEGSSCSACGAPVSPEDLVGHVLLCPSCQAVSRADGDAIEVVGTTRRAAASPTGPSALPC